MNEMRMPESTNQPPSPQPAANAGSLLGGFGLAWAIFIGGYILAVSVAWFADDSHLPAPIALPLYLVLALTPFAAPLLLAFWFLTHGKPRRAKGIFIAYGSLIAIGLLLVAACFGMLLTADWH